jgi:hypothetical protein
MMLFRKEKHWINIRRIVIFFNRTLCLYPLASRSPFLSCLTSGLQHVIWKLIEHYVNCLTQLLGATLKEISDMYWILCACSGALLQVTYGKNILR